jgi:hypothetical protein
VDRETYRTIETLKAALNTREVDRREWNTALRRLTSLTPAAETLSSSNGAIGN